MALKPGDRTNFKTMLKAAGNGHLSLVECTDQKTGEYRAVVCMMGWDETTSEHIMTPVAKLFEGNPYEEISPPV
jgi:hypothetical protein